MKRMIMLGLALAISAMPALAQSPEQKKVSLGVGGMTALYYLPLLLADSLGCFKEQGLEVEISDFAGGSQALTALVGGSADVVTGAYEHTIRMQAKGQDIVAVIELGRYPGIVLGVRKERADAIRSVADLEGAKIGVSAPGSSTNMMVWYLMSKAGLSQDDASYIGVGIGLGAVAAVESGSIDALSSVDPVVSKLEQAGRIVLLADTRTAQGTTDVFGGPMPAGVLYMRRGYLQKNPGTVQALVNAFYKALKWLEKATPEQIADAVPQEAWLGDKALYIAAVKANLEGYSRTGAIDASGQQRALKYLEQFDKDIAAARVDVQKTWDPAFVARSAETIR